MVFSMAVLLFGRVPPCGAAYFARGGKVGKTPPGTAPMSAYAERALKVAFPTPSGPSGHLPLTGGVGPGPLFTGDTFLFSWQ